VTSAPGHKCGMNALLGSIPATSRRVPHIPDFLWSFVGSLNLMRLSLKERRARGPVQSCVLEIRGISLVFREMWDTAGLPLKPVAGPTEPPGALGSPQRCPDFLLRSTSHDALAACSQRKPHEVAQRHQPRQEIRGKPTTAFRPGPYPLSSRPKRSAVERPTVPFPSSRPEIRGSAGGAISG
jgi:hypothetical protein